MFLDYAGCGVCEPSIWPTQTRKIFNYSRPCRSDKLQRTSNALALYPSATFNKRLPGRSFGKFIDCWFRCLVRLRAMQKARFVKNLRRCFEHALMYHGNENVAIDARHINFPSMPSGSISPNQILMCGRRALEPGK